MTDHTYRFGGHNPDECNSCKKERREATTKNLLDVIGHELANGELGYCMQNSSVFTQFNNSTGLNWWDWEEKTAEPALKKLGYRILRWSTGEGDSFGPLTRVVLVEKDGKREELMYG